MKTRGILIVAAGHPFYGNYASQLCFSIKANNPEIPVAVLTDPLEKGISHVRGSHKFDQVIHIDRVHCTANGLPNYLKIKTALYWYSPFDETLYLDADIIFFPNKDISAFMSQFNDIYFTMANRGRVKINEVHAGFIHWTDLQELKNNLSVKSEYAYNLSSEMMWFKKCDDVEYLFMNALENYDNPPEHYKPFAGVVPDELPFTIAMIETGVEPHESPFLPFYWQHFERHNTANKNLTNTQIMGKWWALSMGGNMNAEQSRDLYNALANNFCRKFGITNYFHCVNKTKPLPERQSI